jgi:ornithine decarboxylase
LPVPARIGGGFPAHYDDTVPAFKSLARTISAELDRLFLAPLEILAEPGRFLVASAATAVVKSYVSFVTVERPLSES